MLVLGLLSAVLMIVDANYELLKPVRSQFGALLTPLYSLGELPAQLWNSATEQFTSRNDLIKENERLRAESLLMERRLQKLATLTEQNVRLRELLNSSAVLDEDVLVTELIGIDPDPYSQRILIDKGSQDGVYIGQPVLESRGLAGQVIEVMPYSARVLLITDPSHGIPVQVNRNGLRTIAVGTTDQESMDLRHVSNNADIKEGDLLVTSGMGQRFPAGYPVAIVTHVEPSSSQPFAQIAAKPTAALSRTRFFMLVFNKQDSVDLRKAQLEQVESDERAVEQASEVLQGTEKPETSGANQ